MEWLIPYKLDDDTPARDAPVPPALKTVSPNPQANLPGVAVAGACALTLERWLPPQLAQALSIACGSPGDVAPHNEPAVRHPGAVLLMGR